jgi:hypothetical protein
MKKIIPIILSLTLVGCTTGSKTKTNINYYSNVSYVAPAPQPEPRVIYRDVPVEVVRYEYKTIYERVPPRQASITELGEELARKMLRKMRAAYNET